MIDIHNLWLNANIRIDLMNMIRAGNRLRQAFSRVALSEHGLPLQIRKFNKVTISKAELADARARQHFSLRRTERAAANYQRPRTEKALLTFLTDPVEENLAAVSIDHVI